MRQDMVDRSHLPMNAAFRPLVVRKGAARPGKNGSFVPFVAGNFRLL